MTLFEVVTTHPQIIQHMQDAVYETLKIYASSEIVPKPHYVESHTSDFEVTVIGMLALQEKGTASVLTLGFSHEVFIQVYENMFKEKLIEVSSESADLAGELVNIIFQTIDPELRALGYLFEASLPKVLTTVNLHEWVKISTQQSLILPFSTESGDILFEVFETKG
jgi:CheY-specific phosphatase CheX